LVNVAVGKKTEVTLREVGGSMAPIWTTYYKDSSTVMVSNAATCIHRCPFAFYLLLLVLFLRPTGTSFPGAYKLSKVVKNVWNRYPEDSEIGKELARQTELNC